MLLMLAARREDEEVLKCHPEIITIGNNSI
jgi:hypothetical protein